MIWVTGDKHGQIEAFEDNPNFKKIKKNDTLIVCGDFGFVWDNSAKEQKNLKKLSKKHFQIAFVDGCYENFSLLEDYPDDEWNGGQVKRITENIVWLQRGECYTIDNKQILAFGGGSNKNNESFDTDLKWYADAPPTEEQVDNVIKNMAKHKGNFDIVISHEPPLSIKQCLESKTVEPSDINNILEEIKNHSSCKVWFFGSNHIDRAIPPVYRAIFDDIVKVEDLDNLFSHASL